MERTLLFLNIWLAVRALLASSLYVISATALGSKLLGRFRIEVPGFHCLLAFVVGATICSLTFTLLSLCQLAFPWLIGVLALLPLLVYYQQVVILAKEIRAALQSLRADRLACVLVCLTVLPYVIYALLNCITNPSGPDLAIYHLVIPRDVLRTHGFHYEGMFFGAGLQYGWQFFGLPAYLLGGERGYICLSLWAFLGLLWWVFQGTRRLLGLSAFHGVLAIFAVAFVCCTMSRCSISNNDVPSVLIEAVGVIIALGVPRASPQRRSILLGVVCGFLISIKLTTLPSVLLLMALFLWNLPERRARAFLTLAAAALPLAVLWPAVTLYHSGSPLPQFMMTLRFTGEPLVHMRESVPYMTHWFGIWYQDNYLRFFTGGMSGLSLILLGIPLAVLCSAHYRRDRATQWLLGYALTRWLLIVLLAGCRNDSIFHDRYHMLSYIVLTWCGLRGWEAIGGRLGVAPYQGKLRVAVIGLVLIVVVHQMTTGFTMVFPDPPGPEQTTVDIPSMVREMSDLCADFSRPWTCRSSPGMSWIAHHLPKDAVIAGTMVAPYWARRTYRQLLPMAQTHVDLSKSPEEILAALRATGATHLHLSWSSGLPPFMTKISWKWLSAAGRIPALPGVRVLFETPPPGREAIYDISAATPPSPATLATESSFFPDAAP